MAGPMVQQGSVDWVALSNTSVSFSVELISRFARAGIDIFTITVAQAMFSQFHFPGEGQQRLHESLSKLKAFSSLGDILWFGIGVKHVVRTLAGTEQGACCIAICACLSVCYPLEFSAHVLKALCDKSRDPGTLTPALSQWATLIQVCSGTILASQFPPLVEGFSRIFSSPPRGRWVSQAPASPDQLVSGLFQLARISNGTIQSVTISGGVDCSCLAAIAVWVFDIRVAIFDTNGLCLYRSGSQDMLLRPMQVIFLVYDALYTATNPTQMMLVSSCQIAPGRLYFGTTPPHQHHEYFYGGCSPWSSTSYDTSGLMINKPLSLENVGAFGQLLYLDLVPVPDTNYDRYKINSWPTYPSAGRKEELQTILSSASPTLPELAGLVELIDNVRIEPYVNDQSLGCVSILQKGCDCDTCRPGGSHRPYSERIPPDTDLLCLCYCAATISQFVMILSSVDADESISPSAIGLLNLYATTIERRRRRMYSGDNIESCCDELQHDMNVLWREFLRNPLPYVLTLLVGPCGMALLQQDSSRNSAVCKNGICVFFPSLECPTSGVKQQLRLRAVIGQIEYNGRHVTAIRDSGSAHDKFPLPLRFREIDEQGISIEVIRDLLTTLGRELQFELIVEETFSSHVNAHFRIKGPALYDDSDDHSMTANYTPASFWAKLLRSTYQEPCMSMVSNQPLMVKKNSNTGQSVWSGGLSLLESGHWMDRKIHEPFHVHSDEVLLATSNCLLRASPSVCYWILVTNALKGPIMNLRVCILPSGSCLQCCLNYCARNDTPYPPGGPLQLATFLDNSGPELTVHSLRADQRYLDMHDYGRQSNDAEGPENSSSKDKFSSRGGNSNTIGCVTTKRTAE